MSSKNIYLRIFYIILAEEMRIPPPQLKLPQRLTYNDKFYISHSFSWKYAMPEQNDHNINWIKAESQPSVDYTIYYIIYYHHGNIHTVDMSMYTSYSQWSCTNVPSSVHN